MKNISYLFKIGKISRIIEDERNRYLNFFSNSYKENLQHSQFVIKKFPRWSIISGYYTMHDLAKLFLADKFGVKIEFNVHETTIIVLKELTKDKEIIKTLNLGYKEFIKLLNDLAKAKSERTKAQYYTGSGYLREHYKKQAKTFSTQVFNFINRIKRLK